MTADLLHASNTGEKRQSAGPVGMNTFLIFVYPLNSGVFLVQNSEAENLVLIEMLDANEDGEVDSFEWTTMLSQV